jgi:hypothetical protein
MIFSMASLLAKFRIDYSDLKVIPDITKKPRESTVSFFESLISEFKQIEGTTDGESSDHASKTHLVYFETCMWFHVEKGVKTKCSTFELKSCNISTFHSLYFVLSIYLFIQLVN